MADKWRPIETVHKDRAARMTARQIIEARLGRKLPQVRDMRPDERRAVKLLAIQLIKARGKASHD